MRYMPALTITTTCVVEMKSSLMWKSRQARVFFPSSFDLLTLAIFRKNWFLTCSAATRGQVRCSDFLALIHNLSVHFGNCRCAPWCSTAWQWTTYQHSQWIISVMLSSESGAPEGQSLVRYGKGKETLRGVFIVLGSWCLCNAMHWSKLVVVLGREENMIPRPPWGSEIRELSPRAERQGKENSAKRRQRLRNGRQLWPSDRSKSSTVTWQVITAWCHKAKPSGLSTTKP